MLQARRRDNIHTLLSRVWGTQNAGMTMDTTRTVLESDNISIFMCKMGGESPASCREG